MQSSIFSLSVLCNDQLVDQKITLWGRNPEGFFFCLVFLPSKRVNSCAFINKCYDEEDSPYPLSFWLFLPPSEAGLPGNYTCVQLFNVAEHIKEEHLYIFPTSGLLVRVHHHPKKIKVCVSYY